MNILERYKNNSSEKIAKRLSKSYQNTEIGKRIVRVFVEALGFVPVAGQLKTSYDVVRTALQEAHEWQLISSKSYLSQYDGKNIKRPYRTDIFVLSEQDQAIILKRQFEYAQEQKTIAEKLMKLNNDELCWISAEYEESRESITSSLVYALFLDKFKENLNETDSSFDNFIIIKNHLRELKHQQTPDDKNDDGDDRLRIKQRSLEQIEKQELTENLQIHLIQPLTRIEELNKQNFVPISNEILLNALKVLETSPESENTHAFFNAYY